MLEVEIQKLTAAIQALTGTTEALVTATMQMRSSLHLIAGDIKEATVTPTNSDKPRQKKAKVTADEVEALVEAARPILDHEPVHDLKSSPPAPAPAPAPDITADDLKTVAMELARADSSARPAIIQILADHNAKTITQLDPKQYNSVHGALLKLAKSIYDNSEAV
jgi:hypothetical protein